MNCRLTTPYAPQENALAERINRTLMEKVRASLSHSVLHSVHLQGAINNAVFKYIITYHYGINKISHKVWYNTKTPHKHHILTFGQLGYGRILKPNRPKLQKKAN